jgi:hypothetical protein
MKHLGRLTLGALLLAGTAVGATAALTTPASAAVVVGVGAPYPYYPYYGYPYYGYYGPYVGVGWGWRGGCCWGGGWGWRGGWGGWHGGWGGWHGGWGGWHGGGFHGAGVAAHFGGRR